MNSTHKTAVLSSVFLATALAQTAAADMHSRESAYVGIDLGVAEQEEVTLNMRDNDVPTRCDQVLRESHPGATGFMDISVASLADENGCKRGQDVWSRRHDVGTGFVAGLQAGHMFGDFRAEVEYLYRNHSSGGRRSNSDVTPTTAELVSDEQGLDGLSSHSIFANLYYDLTNSSRFTPYIGAGIGFSRIDYVFDALYQRNNNPDSFGAATPAVAAGTTTDTDDELSDEVFGYQLMVGSDYAIDENWSIGLKLRYQHFDDPEDSSRWDRLRSHDSEIADGRSLERIRNSDPSLADFDPTVTYHVEVEDIEVWAASLNLKYKF